MIPRIFIRTLRSQRRVYSAGDGPKTPLDAVKKRDELRYGGLKSLDILTSERHAHDVRDMTQKPLWHAWQLFTASVVPFGLWIYLEQVEAGERGAENGSRDGSRDVEPSVVESDGIREDGTASSPTQLATSLAKLEQRLARVEQRLHARDADR